MKVLSVLFGGIGEVRILRLLAANPGVSFEISEIADRSRVPTGKVRTYLNKLYKVGLVSRRRRGRSSAYLLNQSFAQIEALTELVLGSAHFSDKDLRQYFKNAGKIQLLIATGVFVKRNVSPVDLLVVGDNLKASVVSRRIKELEGDIGREICYALMTTEEFKQRLDMSDRLLRDILDFDHRKIVEKIPV